MTTLTTKSSCRDSSASQLRAFLSPSAQQFAARTTALTGRGLSSDDGIMIDAIGPVIGAQKVSLFVQQVSIPKQRDPMARYIIEILISQRLGRGVRFIEVHSDGGILPP